MCKVIMAVRKRLRPRCCHLLSQGFGSPMDVVSYSMGETEKGRVDFNPVQSHNRKLPAVGNNSPVSMLSWFSTRATGTRGLLGPGLGDQPPKGTTAQRHIRVHTCYIFVWQQRFTQLSDTPISPLRISIFPSTHSPIIPSLGT